VLAFWTAREIFARGGIRVASRGIAATGLALALVGLLQHATAPARLYWFYPTIFGAPFGPFLNRNDFAAWLIMALPLSIGYMLTRVASYSPTGDVSLSLVHLADRTMVWLAAAACLMTAALLTSLSRSGLLGALASLACLLSLSRFRGGVTDRGSLWVGALVVAVVAIAYANLGALADRVGETLASGIGGRRTIWRETWPMVRDFCGTGVGAGAYERAMLVYQRTKGLFYFNHAHDEYLQIAAEGGALLGIPAVLVMVASIRRIAGQLRADRTPIFWVRAGAASGLVAAAVQSVWDTGLRMPANAILFAILAALAMHPGRNAQPSEPRARGA